MTNASNPLPATASQVFDAALARGRTAMAEPTPVLRKIDPASGPARVVSELRAVLSARFLHAVPAANASELHQSTLQALRRLERKFYWRRVRLIVSDFLMTYSTVILGFLVIAALVGLSILFGEAILAFVAELIAPPPPPPAPAAAVPGAEGAAPAGTTP